MNPEQTQKQEAAAVKEMLNTTGWTVLESKITQRLNADMASLVEAKDIEIVRTLQGRITARKELLQEILTYAGIR